MSRNLVPIGDLLSDVQPGFASGENLSDGTLQVRMNNVKPDGSWDWTKKRFVPATKRQLEKYSLKAGDVLFNITNSAEQVGKSALCDRKIEGGVCFSNHFLRLRVDSRRLQSSYLVRYLGYLWQRRVFENMVDAWVNQATVRREDLLAIKIPLPSLPDQKRIAAVLDQADTIRRKRQQAVQLADEFLRAVFLDMFGDPVTNSKGWEMRRLKDVAIVTTGNTPPRGEARYYGDYIEWIKSDNINTPSHFLTTAMENLSKEGAKVGRIAPAGSVLVTCIAGSFDCIGNAAYADRPVAFNQQINALTPKDGLDDWFFYAMILFSKRKIQLASTNSMKGMISKGKMEEIAIIFPPIEDQISFRKIFMRYIDVTSKFTNSLLHAGDVFSVLTKNAFSGNA